MKNLAKFFFIGDLLLADLVVRKTFSRGLVQVCDKRQRANARKETVSRGLGSKKIWDAGYLDRIRVILLTNLEDTNTVWNLRRFP
jgi:hypothetical protein